MAEPKVIEQFPEEAPVDARKGRKGVLWVDKNRDGEIFFVNSSQETLSLVSADSGGFQTCDDTVLPISSTEGYHYRNVIPGSAVKVDAYDDYYDLDYVLQITIRVQSPGLGEVDIVCPPEKGGISTMVLMWDNGELGKYVTIRKCSEF